MLSKISGTAARAAIAIALGMSMLGSTMVASFAQGAAIAPSGLPLPRYVSLKSSRVNMRVGPGREYQVEWMYLKQGLPMEIIQEYDNWRKVRDPEGNEGWILHSLLSGARTVIVAPWDTDRQYVDMLDKAESGARVVARIEPGVVASVKACINGWCELSIDGASGYMRQNRLWGVYPDEKLDD